MGLKTRERKVIVLYPRPAVSATDDSQHEQPKKRVAAYCRVSSASDEQLQSIKAQIDHYRSFIASHPDYEPVGIFADEGISGTGIIKRDAFNRLMESCRAGDIDMVITKSVSRFGRNTVDTLNSVRELKALGVDVYFEKEAIRSMNSEGEVLLTLISAVAENESLTLSENVKWGIRRKYENGSVKSIPLGKFLGYDKDAQGKLIINRHQADIIRRIYREFLDGFGITQIADRLTADGIPSEQGNTVWNFSSIRKMLTNEKYKGDTLFQKTYHTNHLTKKRAKNHGELPKYYLEGSHPAIVDHTVWACVQLELGRQESYCNAHHITGYHRNSEEHPLSARITCATCGCTYMALKSNRVGEEGREYWRCSSYIGKHGSAVIGRTFTPRPMPLWSKFPDTSHARYRAKHRKLPKERQMLCTDIEIPHGAPEKAFVKAWNIMISHRLQFVTDFAGLSEKSEDMLLRYRAQELHRLVAEGISLKKLDYALSLKVLDHIEVTPGGELVVIFLTGTKITI